VRYLRIGVNTRLGPRKREPKRSGKDKRPKRACRNTLEQRIRRLERENKRFWEIISKIKATLGMPHMNGE
jgi:hypothetical protein